MRAQSAILQVSSKPTSFPNTKRFAFLLAFHTFRWKPTGWVGSKGLLCPRREEGLNKGLWCSKVDCRPVKRTSEGRITGLEDLELNRGCEDGPLRRPVVLFALFEIVEKPACSLFSWSTLSNSPTCLQVSSSTGLIRDLTFLLDTTYADKQTNTDTLTLHTLTSTRTK